MQVLQWLKTILLTNNNDSYSPIKIWKTMKGIVRSNHYITSLFENTLEYSEQFYIDSLYYSRRWSKIYKGSTFSFPNSPFPVHICMHFSCHLSPACHCAIEHLSHFWSPSSSFSSFSFPLLLLFSCDDWRTKSFEIHVSIHCCPHPLLSDPLRHTEKNSIWFLSKYI